MRTARFRLESEIREGRYREVEEKRRCRLCGWAEEFWKHVVEVCIGKGKSGERKSILRILEDDGRGEGWMKKL